MKRKLFICLFAGLFSSAAAASEDPSLTPAATSAAAPEPPEPARRLTTPEPAGTASSPTPEPAPGPAAGKSGERANTPRKNSAAQIVSDGTFLPLTVSARIGDQYVSAMALGGYDSAPGEGGQFTAVAEAALFNRLALRVSTDYSSGHGDPQLSAGLRLGVLRQELHHIDLGFVALYKNTGFTESNGEIEVMLTLGRRWGRWGLFGNLVYGQGFEQQERDGEVRVAVLYSVHERINIGFDTRGRFDLGEASAQGDSTDHPFDLVAGPLVSVSVGPIALLAQAGFHALMLTDNGQDSFTAGALAMAGVGGAY